MSKNGTKRGVTNTKKRSNTAQQKKSAKSDLADYLALMPGLFMCFMLVLILILDISMPDMSEKQYEDFPNIFTVLDYAATVCGLVYIAVSAKRKNLRFEKSDALFAAFAALILLSTCVNGFNEMSVNGVPYRYIGIFNMFAFMLIYMGVTRSVKRDSFGDLIMVGYMAAADLIGLAAAADMITGNIEAFHGKKELSAVFFNGNHYGYFLLMAVLAGLGYYLFAERKKAVFGAVTAAFNMLLLIINHSLGSILALLAVVLVTGIIVIVKDKRFRKRFAVLAAAVIVVFISALLISPEIRKEFAGLAADMAAILNRTAEGSAGHRRLAMWRLTAAYISEKPILGYGCEGIALMLYKAMKVSNPHCEFLTYAAYYGIPAAALYAAGVLASIILCIRRTEKNGAHQKAACMAAAGYFISSFVGVGMFYTLPFLFIFLGLSLKR